MKFGDYLKLVLKYKVQPTCELYKKFNLPTCRTLTCRL